MSFIVLVAAVMWLAVGPVPHKPWVAAALCFVALVLYIVGHRGAVFVIG
jgi:hypothetical protein